jgi:hypothetical protein
VKHARPTDIRRMLPKRGMYFVVVETVLQVRVLLDTSVK